jgi:ubiquinone/menaquinone biosynthesis C-methylase UbiE
MASRDQQRVNYDRIAARYDCERYRSKELDPDLLDFLAQRGDRDPAEMALLDIGCGTGSQLVADRAHVTEMRMVGLDLFAGMLRQARLKSNDIHWVQGNGACLPFAAASFDLVTSQFSFHHVQDKRAMLSQVCRVLRPGGRFVMTNICPREMRGWAIYRYFPAAWQRDMQDFAPREEIAAWMQAVGFARVRISLQRFRPEEDLDALARATRPRVTSQLVALTDAEYRCGMRQIEQESHRAETGERTISSEWCLLRIVGDV